jgi:hypothetical protein
MSHREIGDGDHHNTSFSSTTRNRRGLSASLAGLGRCARRRPAWDNPMARRVEEVRSIMEWSDRCGIEMLLCDVGSAVVVEVVGIHVEYS